jgi:hypothetical protein
MWRMGFAPALLAADTGVWRKGAVVHGESDGDGLRSVSSKGMHKRTIIFQIRKKTHE